jgi:hypothetical protein
MFDSIQCQRRSWHSALVDALPFFGFVAVCTAFTEAVLLGAEMDGSPAVLAALIALAGIGTAAGMIALLQSGQNRWLWGFLGFDLALGMAGFFGFGPGLLLLALGGGVFTVMVSWRMRVPAIDWNGLLFEAIGFGALFALMFVPS